HAWVEYPGPGGVTWVSDPSQDLTCPRSVYYFLADIGAVEGNRVWRYTPEEARGEMLRTGHYGPWVDGWEEMGL
ncbi:MAG TPA: hypothetical protein VFV36_10275, partial [Candidatus Methylomirabilis sp.]|nr:hypothetical protein [Candidatus Methylomirabilis sp.]